MSSWRLRSQKRWAALAVLAFGLLALAGTACSRGSYPLDYFQEMHYQQSYRIQEPPRLQPPEGSVPITGKSVVLTPKNMSSMANPFPGQRTDEGARLFAVNCSMCHGASAEGDGLVLNKMVGEPYNYEVKVDPNLTKVAALPDFLLFAIITNRDLFIPVPKDPKIPRAVMPRFGNLLTEEERWMLVNYIKSLAP